MVIDTEKNVTNDTMTAQSNGPAPSNQTKIHPNTSRHNSVNRNVGKGTLQSSHSNSAKSGFDDNKSSSSITTQNNDPVRRYYIDELGFYRYLDADGRQYVCSNVGLVERNNSPSPVAKSTATTEMGSGKMNSRTNSGNIIRRNISIQSEIGLENCMKTLRHDLGISHFDKIEEYASWKSDWDEFMQDKLESPQPYKLNCKLRARVRSGIPHDYRCKIWTALIRMRTSSIRAKFGDDIYQVIIRDYVSNIEIPNYISDDQNNNDINSTSSSSSSSNRAYKANGSSYIGPNQVDSRQKLLVKSSSPLMVQDKQMDKCFKQIELDLLRTLPNNRHFEDPNSIGIQRVRRVLRAYACFNRAIGYCQGMNRLAAIALLVLPEEEAFWCLVAIIQSTMPKDYYLKPWLARVDCCVLIELLEKKMPKLHKHLVNNDIELPPLFSWFFTIFVDGFRPELMLRIWDCFLLEGDNVLFRFALSILYIAQDDLLNMNDFSAMIMHLSRLVSTRKLDVEQLFAIAFNTMEPLSSAIIETKRNYHRNKNADTLDSRTSQPGRTSSPCQLF